jgi:hypothetical protein
MRFFATGSSLLFSMLVAATILDVQPAAADSYCPNSVHASPAKVPVNLVSAVAKAFQIDDGAVRAAAYVRCVGPKLMGCYIGANLDCFKAETRRTLPGATAWCSANPGSQIIPMAATGHDTIYEWSCNGRHAVAGKAMATVDPQGYIAENWKEIPQL